MLRRLFISDFEYPVGLPFCKFWCGFRYVTMDFELKMIVYRAGIVTTIPAASRSCSRLVMAKATPPLPTTPRKFPVRYSVTWMAYPVSMDVTNTGAVVGKEVVRVYVHDRKSTLVRPDKELNTFAKVELRPGETKPSPYAWISAPLLFTTPVTGTGLPMKANSTF